MLSQHAVALISRDTIEKILHETDIVDLIGSYVQLKRAGSVFKANCPFHHEKTPSFSVDPRKQFYHCFGCKKGGNAISFVKDFENLPFLDAVKKLAQRAKIPIVEDIYDPQAEKNQRSRGRLLDVQREAATFLHRLLLQEKDAAHAREYLQSRGFNIEMAKRWNLGWMPRNPRAFLNWARSWKFTGNELVAAGLAGLREEGNPVSGLYVRFSDRLVFPICNEIGDVIAFSCRKLNEAQPGGKYINSPETAVFRKSKVFFALDRAKQPILKEKHALLCEGQIDAICCHEAGISQAIATCGTACTQQHARLLKRYTTNVVICYDADAAGLAASEKAVRELFAEGLTARIVEMPTGHDPDSFIKAQGAEAFRKLISEAKDYFDFKLTYARSRGALESAADRSLLVSQCAALLAVMSDLAARDYQINVVATFLQGSAAALRQAISKVRAVPQRPLVDRSEILLTPVTPTPLHRIVSCLCHLALGSATAQHFLAEQFETLHEANRWFEGIPLLEKILVAAPDATSHAAVNAFLSSLPEADQLALTSDGEIFSDTAERGIHIAENALSLLSSGVLQRRDAAVKAALKTPGIEPMRLQELLEEAKEIQSLMRGIGQRSEFDDDLPPATFKEKQAPWKTWPAKRMNS